MSAGRWIAGGALVGGLVAGVVYGRASCAPTPGEPATIDAPTAPGLDYAAKSAGWVRAVEPEPAPAARGLYRRAIDLAHRGDPAGSAAAVEQLRSDYADTRFGARVADEGDLRGGVALVTAMAAVVVAVAARADETGAGSP